MKRTIVASEIPAFVALYEKMRDPKYKSAFGMHSPPRIEWVALGGKDKVQGAFGIGRLLTLPLGNSVEQLSDDEELLSSLHYCIQVIKRYARKGGIYIKELNASQRVVREYFLPVSKAVGPIANAQLIGFQPADEDGSGLVDLWNSHPKAQYDIMVRLTVNVFKEHPMPIAMREFVGECLLGNRTLPKKIDPEPPLRSEVPEVFHRDYLLHGLAITIRNATKFSLGASQTRLIAGSPVPLCGASLVISALRTLGVTINQRTGILDANQKSKQFHMDNQAAEILMSNSWATWPTQIGNLSDAAPDFSVEVKECLEMLTYTL